MSFALYTYISSVRYEQLEFSMLSCLRCDILVTVNTDVSRQYGDLLLQSSSMMSIYVLEEGHLIVV